MPLVLGLERGLEALGERLPGALLPDRLHHHLLLHRRRHPPPPPSAEKLVVGWGTDLAAALGRDQIAISRGGGAGEVREREDAAIP